MPLVSLVSAMPVSVALRLARILADVYYHADSRRRATAVSNIQRAGVVGTEVAARRLARESFRHFAAVLVESLKAGEVFDERNWRERAEVAITPACFQALESAGQGVLLVSGHLGNWELAAQLVSFVKPVVGITRRMSNPHVEQVIQRLKPRNRFRLTPKHDAGDPGRLVSVLKGGEVLALLIDQYGGGRGVPVDFFGSPASTHAGVALLHLITRAPLCFGYCVRTGKMKFRLVAGDPVTFERTGRKEDDVRRILTTLTGQLEGAIRLYPEQYLWAHRRWRG